MKGFSRRKNQVFLTFRAPRVLLGPGDMRLHEGCRNGGPRSLTSEILNTKKNLVQTREWAAHHRGGHSAIAIWRPIHTIWYRAVHYTSVSRSTQGSCARRMIRRSCSRFCPLDTIDVLFLFQVFFCTALSTAFCSVPNLHYIMMTSRFMVW